MANVNSQNIRIFTKWFGIDSKSKKAEAELAALLREKNPCENISWTEEGTSFWAEEKTSYIRHFCSDGSSFNYPVKVSEIPGKIDIIILRAERFRIGKIRGAEDRLQDNVGELDYFSKLAKQDVKDNPIPEQGFDWEHVRKEIGNDIF